MNLFTQYKNVFVAIILIGIAFFAYSFFAGGEDDAVLTEVATNGNSSVDNELIALLLELKSIRLDETVFTDPAFQSLQDFSQTLVVEPVGRVNPFAPLGR